MEIENGYGYGGYGHGLHYMNGFTQVERTLGDVEARLLMQAGDNQAHISNLVSGAKCDILTKVGDAECSVLTKLGGVESSVLREIAGAESSITKQVGGAESKIVDRMGTYAQDNFKNQSDIAQRNFVALTAMERDLQNRLHETRFLLSKEVSDKTERVTDKAELQFADVKNQLRYFETSVAKQFCNIETEGLKNTSRILETLAANKYDALKDEVDAIRSDRYADKYGYNFALQNQELSYLKQMIGSVENNQRFGSKTVQFGTGNTAGTAQTANQG